MREREVTVVSRKPPYGDEVPDDVESYPFPAALRAEYDVVASGEVDEPAAEPTAPVVAGVHLGPDTGGDVLILTVLAAAAQQMALKRRRH